jgi:hypothetical protein
MKTRPMLVCCIVLLGCHPEERSGQVLDESRSAGYTVDDFSAALGKPPKDHFHGMDGGIELSEDEIKGRNTWLVWTGGNDRMWDWIAMQSEGTFDLLKTLSSHPALKFNREKRWKHFGLVNEPCFEAGTDGDLDRFGLVLDKRRDGCKADPFENEAHYPGLPIGARGKTVWNGRTLPVGSFYGYATGVVGLRLFPNPAFDQKAADNWDPKRYYTDPTYYNRPDLVRPYRVGMSCAFCHVGPNPLKPPSDPENPRWENLSSNVGAQYLDMSRVFFWEADERMFLFQLFKTSRPGTLDTSFIATDGINNPRSMNAVYELGARLQHARRWGKETLVGAGVHQKHLAGTFDPPHTAWVPRILKDGADSVGGLGALNRVYLNIGVFSEESLRHVSPMVGATQQTPLDIAVARQNSAYWQATEQQTPNVAQFFLKSTKPHRLKDAPGGKDYLKASPDTLRKGKFVFAENCAHCHSSKLPSGTPLDPGGCAGRDYLSCLDQYWEWTRTPAFKAEVTAMVLRDDFLNGNFLSTDLRVPATVLQTNLCSALATNATAGRVWDNFSSDSYKNLPSVGAVTVQHPITGETRLYDMPAGGRGYTRPPSLVSLWSTAPYLLNNSVGRYEPSPSVAARMSAFQDGIEKLLWPERREKDASLGNLNVGLIDRTQGKTCLSLSQNFLPEWSRPLLPQLSRWFRQIGVEDGRLEIGPIPEGTPINVLANVQLRAEEPNLLKHLVHSGKVLLLLHTAMHDYRQDAKKPAPAAPEPEQTAESGPHKPCGLPPRESRPREPEEPASAGGRDPRSGSSALVDRLLDLSKCPDFVVNRGHSFGSTLSGVDKRALIEFLKTF